MKAALIALLLMLLLFCACSRNENRYNTQDFDDSFQSKESSESGIQETPDDLENDVDYEHRQKSQEPIHLIKNKENQSYYYVAKPLLKKGTTELLMFDKNGVYVGNYIFDERIEYNSLPQSIMANLYLDLKYKEPGYYDGISVHYPRLIDLATNETKVGNVRIDSSWGGKILSNGLVAVESYATEQFDIDGNIVGNTYSEVVLLNNKMELNDVQLKFDYLKLDTYQGKEINGIIYNPDRKEYIVTCGLVDPTLEDHPLYVSVFDSNGNEIKNLKFCEQKNVIVRRTKSNFMFDIFLLSQNEVLLCSQDYSSKVIYVNLDTSVAKELSFSSIHSINKDSRTISMIGSDSTIVSFYINQSGDITEFERISIIPDVEYLNKIKFDANGNSMNRDYYGFKKEDNKLYLYKVNDNQDREPMMILQTCGENGCHFGSVFEADNDVILAQDKFYILHS